MNRTHRKCLQEIVIKLEELADAVDDILEEEEVARDNTPENLQNTARYEFAEMVCCELGDAASAIREAIEDIESVTN